LTALDSTHRQLFFQKISISHFLQRFSNLDLRKDVKDAKTALKILKMLPDGPCSALRGSVFLESILSDGLIESFAHSQSFCDELTTRLHPSLSDMIWSLHDRLGITAFAQVSLKLLEFPDAVSGFSTYKCHETAVHRLSVVNITSKIRLLQILEVWTLTYGQSRRHWWLFGRDGHSDVVKFWRSNSLLLTGLLGSIHGNAVSKGLGVAVSKLLIAIVSLDQILSLVVFDKLFLDRGQFFAVECQPERVRLFEIVVEAAIADGGDLQRVALLLCAEFSVVWTATHEDSRLLQLISNFLDFRLPVAQLELPEGFDGLWLEWRAIVQTT
jgi:hypothetical protein